MSRPSTSLLRSLPRAARTQTRGLLGGPSPRSSPAAGNTTSIDYRILSGLDGFLPKDNFDRITEWQAGLWTRLQDEVRSESIIAIVMLFEIASRIFQR